MLSGFNGLPPMATQANSATMFGQVDLNRNGAPPNGIHADLRTPTSDVEQRAAPAAAAASKPGVVLVALVAVLVLLNGTGGGKKKR